MNKDFVKFLGVGWDLFNSIYLLFTLLAKHCCTVAKLNIFTVCLMLITKPTLKQWYVIYHCLLAVNCKSKPVFVSNLLAICIM